MKFWIIWNDEFAICVGVLANKLMKDKRRPYFVYV
jgi:hypothetical protein